MEFVGDVEGGENGDFARIDGQSAGRDFAHTLIDVFGELLEIFRVAVRAHGVSLIVDFDFDGRRCFQFFIQAESVSVHRSITSTTSGSAAAIASSIDWTLARMASRSASRCSSWAANSCWF